jgi:hypothetical protein
LIQSCSIPVSVPSELKTFPMWKEWFPLNQAVGSRLGDRRVT